MQPTLLGAYGPWAASIVGEGPARLSFRNDRWTDLESWRDAARGRLEDLLLQPDTGGLPDATVHRRFQYDGLDVEQLSWGLPYGPPTEALFLKPAGHEGPLPGVLALHDHGGNKHFGYQGITRVDDHPHPMMQEKQDRLYGGVAWANEIARRGYAVLIHDAFSFGSRRVRLADVHEVVKSDPERTWEPHYYGAEEDPVSEEDIVSYNQWAAAHEHVMAKSLFSAGTTWPGIFTAEDQRALDYLCSRPDVDERRVGCGGLSGGGLRAVYLTGVDERIRCACTVGMMTTWRDPVLDKSNRWSWMVFIPGLPREMDYSEIFGLNVPNPILVLNNNEDGLFTLPEMQRADRILAEVYRKAGAEDRFQGSFYPGPHKFDLPMQAEAFDFFDRCLSPNPPKDTDGRCEESGRGVRELQGK